MADIETCPSCGFQGSLEEHMWKHELTGGVPDGWTKEKLVRVLNYAITQKRDHNWVRAVLNLCELRDHYVSSTGQMAPTELHFGYDEGDEEGDRLVDGLILALSWHGKERRWAAKALGMINSETAVDALIESLPSIDKRMGSSRLRWSYHDVHRANLATIEALRKIYFTAGNDFDTIDKIDNLIGQMIAALKDGDESMEEYLLILSSEIAVDTLLELGYNYGLAKSGYIHAIDSMIETLEREGYDDKIGGYGVREIFEKIPDDSRRSRFVLPFITELKENDTQNAALYLGECRCDLVTEALIECLATSGFKRIVTWFEVVRSLGKIGGERATKALIFYLEEKWIDNEERRDHLVQALIENKLIDDDKIDKYAKGPQ